VNNTVVLFLWHILILQSYLKESYICHASIDTQAYTMDYTTLQCIERRIGDICYRNRIRAGARTHLRQRARYGWCNMHQQSPIKARVIKEVNALSTYARLERNAQITCNVFYRFKKRNLLLFFFNPFQMIYF